MIMMLTNDLTLIKCCLQVQWHPTGSIAPREQQETMRGQRGKSKHGLLAPLYSCMVPNESPQLCTSSLAGEFKQSKWDVLGTKQGLEYCGALPTETNHLSTLNMPPIYPAPAPFHLII